MASGIFRVTLSGEVVFVVILVVLVLVVVLAVGLVNVLPLLLPRLLLLLLPFRLRQSLSACSECFAATKWSFMFRELAECRTPWSRDAILD